MANSKKVGLCLGLAVALCGCATTNPEKTSVIAQPTTPIVKNITSFSNSLRCMDELFLDYGKRDIVITSDGLPDETGTISAGTKDMMITTLSKMSEKSKAFKFVDIERGGAVEFIQASANMSFSLPNYYIRGAVTQVDRGVATDSAGAGIALPWASLGYGKDQLLSIVTLDLNVGDTIQRQIIPGLHTTNTITLVRTGQGVDTEGIIEKASLYFEVSQDRSQGTHQSLRTLIELSLIEVLGKLTKVPYWRCLGLETTNPTMIKQARDWYDGLEERTRVEVVQAALASTGDYQGAVDGAMSAPFRQAIQRYQARNDLVANGRINFDLYYRLLADNRAVVPTGESGTASPRLASSRSRIDENPQSAGYQRLAPAQPSVDHSAAGRDPVGLTIAPAGGTSRNFRVGDELVFRVNVEQPADVHCYYEYADEGKYRVARVFPNHQQRDARILPRESLSIPGDGADFKLVLHSSGVREQFACIATSKNFRSANVPEFFSEGSLTPLTIVQRLYQVVEAYQQADSLYSSVKTISWRVL